MQVEQIDRDLLYLVRLAAWCCGQGFCQIEGLTDPDEWCFAKWDELGPDSNGDDFSAETLAQSIDARHRHQARAEVVGEIVAWLEEMYENCESIDGMLTRMDSKDELANMMQAKFGGRASSK